MTMLKKKGNALAFALLFGGLGVGEVEARGKRMAQVPNGGIAGCNTCHISGGGTPRNSFGLAIESSFMTAAGAAGDVVWGPDLAALDSDGDGVSNGAELGDTDGTWVTGDANPAGEAFAPGDPESTPPQPDPPTAVAASSWAQIKSLFDGLD